MHKRTFKKPVDRFQNFKLRTLTAHFDDSIFHYFFRNWLPYFRLKILYLFRTYDTRQQINSKALVIRFEDDSQKFQSCELVRRGSISDMGFRAVVFVSLVILVLPVLENLVSRLTSLHRNKYNILVISINYKIIKLMIDSNLKPKWLALFMHEVSATYDVSIS